MIQQYDAFIGDVVLEAKQEFIRSANLELPEKTSQKQSCLHFA